MALHYSNRATIETNGRPNISITLRDDDLSPHELAAKLFGLFPQALIGAAIFTDRINVTVDGSFNTADLRKAWPELADLVYPTESEKEHDHRRT